MDIYWLSAALIIALYPITRSLKKANKVYCITVAALLFFVLGFRDAQVVGVDLVRYSRFYNELKTYSFAQSFSFLDNSPLYFFSNWLFQKAGFSFQFYSSVLAAFELYVIGKYIYKYSSNPMLSFLVTIGMGCYTSLFNILRQGVAMVIVLICFEAMVNKDWKKFVVFAAVAIGFHPTAIIILLFFIMTRLRFSKLLALIYSIILAFFLVFRVQIGYILSSVFFERYIGVYDSIVKVGGTAILCLAVTVAFFAFCYNKVRVKGSLEFYLGHGLILLSLIQVCSSYAYSFTRLNFYFDLMIMTIALPYLTKRDILKEKLGKGYILVRFGIIVISAALMVYLFNGKVNGELIRDYRFFWD